MPHNVKSKPMIVEKLVVIETYSFSGESESSSPMPYLRAREAVQLLNKGVRPFQQTTDDRFVEAALRTVEKGGFVRLRWPR
jgi:hypothetical protein